MVDVVVRMTTKVGFLTDPHVVELSEWIAARFRTSSGWMHGYVDRKSGAQWSCRSLADASRKYSWRGKSWPDDAFSRRGVSVDLRHCACTRALRARINLTPGKNYSTRNRTPCPVGFGDPRT